MTFYDNFTQEFKDYLKKEYGTNEWWNSEDPLVLAYWQINDKGFRLAIPLDKLFWALESVLERVIYNHQLARRKTLEEKGLYNPNLTQTHNLCLEDIQEKINQKWKERQNATL